MTGTIRSESSRQPVCPRLSLPPPLANAAIAASRVGSWPCVGRAVLMIAIGERPHPRHAHWPSGCLHDPADDDAVGYHVAIIVVPFAGWATNRGALEDQIVFVHLPNRPPDRWLGVRNVNLHFTEF